MLNKQAVCQDWFKKDKKWWYRELNVKLNRQTNNDGIWVHSSDTSVQKVELFLAIAMSKFPGVIMVQNIVMVFAKSQVHSSIYNALLDNR